jgi:hypothetical protein
MSEDGAGASNGREAIQRSASSNAGDRRRSLFGRPAAAGLAVLVCFLIRSISVASASQSQLVVYHNQYIYP